VAGLSRVPYTPDGDANALLRLSWRLYGDVEEDCVPLTPEELERLPVHMRNPDACRGRGYDYRLRVRVDGREAVDVVVRPAGARGDRPVYVFRDVPLAPGEHRVWVEFRRRDGAEDDDAPSPLGFDAELGFAPREIVLITYDAAGERLVRRESR